MGSIYEVVSVITPLEAATLLLVQLAAAWVFLYQRKEGRLGGPISGIKAAWLVYAISSWFGLPLLFWGVSWVFQALFVSMTVRGMFEVYLCWKKQWKTAYGLWHNSLQIGLIAVGLLFGDLPNPYVFWLWFLLFGFVSELIFVVGFRRHKFKPSEGVYFVPSGDDGRGLNRLTAIVFLPQYVLWFLLLFWAALGGGARFN